MAVRNLYEVAEHVHQALVQGKLVPLGVVDGHHACDALNACQLLEALITVYMCPRALLFVRDDRNRPDGPDAALPARNVAQQQIYQHRPASAPCAAARRKDDIDHGHVHLLIHLPADIVEIILHKPLRLRPVFVASLPASDMVGILRVPDGPQVLL